MNKIKALQDNNKSSSINIVSGNKKRILLVDDELILRLHKRWHWKVADYLKYIHSMNL